jgi:uncharacterized protein with GYD domain
MRPVSCHLTRPGAAGGDVRNIGKKSLRGTSGPAIVTRVRSSSRSCVRLTEENPVNASQVRSHMATYLSLFNWTDQGIRSVKESPKRLDSTRKALKKLGGELRAFHMLQGQYDGALLFDVPDDAALTKFLLTIGTAGNVRTTTLRAFTEEEFLKHIAAL